MSPPSPLFISSKFSVSGSLPTSSNRLSRRAVDLPNSYDHVYPPLSNSVPRSSRFSGGSTTPPICKPKSAIEERNKAPACFRMATLRLSFLFVYHFISQALLIRLRQDAYSPYESGDPI